MSDQTTYKIVREASIESLEAAVKLEFQNGYVVAGAPYIVESDYAQALVLRTALSPIDFPKACTAVYGEYIGTREKSEGKPIYYVGDEVKNEDYKAWISLKDGNTMPLLSHMFYVSPHLISSTAESEVNIHYKWETNKVGTVPIVPTAVKIKSIAVQKMPTVHHYWAGETWQGLDGLTMVAFYNNGSFRTLSDSEWEATVSPTPVDPLPEQNYTITVTYTGTEPKVTETITTTFTIVSELDLDKTIEVYKYPTKTVYLAGEEFEPAGLVAKVTQKSGKYRYVAFDNPSTDETFTITSPVEPMTEVKTYDVVMHYKHNTLSPEAGIDGTFNVKVARLPILGSPIISVVNNILNVEAGYDPDYTTTRNAEEYTIYCSDGNSVDVTIGRLDLDDALYFSGNKPFTVTVKGFTALDNYTLGTTAYMRYGLVQNSGTGTEGYIAWNSTKYGVGFTTETATEYNDVYRIYLRGTNLKQLLAQYDTEETPGLIGPAITITPVESEDDETLEIAVEGTYEALLNHAAIRRAQQPKLAEASFKGLFFTDLNAGQTSYFVGAVPAITAVSNIPDHCYDSMFYGCDKITSISINTPDTIGDYAFYKTFASCFGLTTFDSWEDEETVLGKHCYEGMFSGCANLKSIPAPKSTHYADYCYAGMFLACASLTDVSRCSISLSDCSSVTGICSQMFAGCIELANIPEIHATKVGPNTFYRMFHECPNIHIWDSYGVHTPEGGEAEDYDNMRQLPFEITSAGTDAMKQMFLACGGNPGTWTDPGTPVLNHEYFTVEHLPYVEFNSPAGFSMYCEQKLWDGSIEYSTDRYHWSTWNVPEVIIAAKSGDLYHIYVRGVDNTTFANRTGHSNLQILGSDVRIATPTDIATGVAAPTGACTFPALLDYKDVRQGIEPTIASAAAYGMFHGDTILTSVYSGFLPTTTIPVGVYYSMFEGSGITAAPDLPATNAPDNCYHSMFRNCKSLTKGPSSGLNASSVGNSSYQNMFDGCISLTDEFAPVLPATKIDTGCYSYMFYGCSKITQVANLPATTIPSGAYSHMYAQSGVAVSATRVEGSYTNEFTIPGNGAATGKPGTGATEHMFYGTQGTFQETPVISVAGAEVPYYSKKAIVNPIVSLRVVNADNPLQEVEILVGDQFTADMVKVYPVYADGSVGEEISPAGTVLVWDIPAAFTTTGYKRIHCYYTETYRYLRLEGTIRVHVIDQPTPETKPYVGIWEGQQTTINNVAPTMPAISIKINASGNNRFDIFNYNKAAWWVADLGKTSTFIDYEESSSFEAAIYGDDPETPLFTVAGYYDEAAEQNTMTFIVFEDSNETSYSVTRKTGYKYVPTATATSGTVTVTLPTGVSKAWYRWYSESQVTPFIQYLGPFSHEDSILQIVGTDASDVVNTMFRLQTLGAAPAKPYVELVADEAFTFSMKAVLGNEWEKNPWEGGALEYNLNPVTTTAWTVYDPAWTDPGTETTVAVSTPLSDGRYHIYLRGTGITSFAKGTAGADGQRKLTLVNSSGVNVTYSAHGDIKYLLEYDTSKTLSTATYIFYDFFGGSNIYSADRLTLSVENLTEGYYEGMFKNCSKLVAGPATLPATTAAAKCYYQMFHNCDKLTTVPAIALTVLASNCCYQMFYNCAITESPALPATTAADYCYCEMFSSCGSLTTIGAIGLTDASGEYCCKGMFTSCGSLAFPPALNVTKVGDHGFAYMFDGDGSMKLLAEKPSTHFCNTYKLPATGTIETLEGTNNFDHMFQGCGTGVDTPTLTEGVWTCYKLAIPSQLTGYWMTEEELGSEAISLIGPRHGFGMYTSPIDPTTFIYDVFDISNGWYHYGNSSTVTFSSTATSTTEGTFRFAWTAFGSVAAGSWEFGYSRDATTGEFTITSAPGEFGGYLPEKKEDWSIYDTPYSTYDATEKQLRWNGYVPSVSGVISCAEFSNDQLTAIGYAEGGTGGNYTYSIQGGGSTTDVLCCLVRSEEDRTVIAPPYWASITDPSYVEFKSTDESNAEFTLSCLDSEGSTSTAKGWGSTVEYSTNTENWAIWDLVDGKMPEISTTTGSIYLRGSGNTYFTHQTDNVTYGIIHASTSVKVIGNAMTLLNHSDTSMITMGGACFASLFSGDTHLQDASDFRLPATTLTQACYSGMFKGCANLATAPELPATTLAESCYSYMFNGCESLGSAPELPATTLVESCYNSMFDGCINLASAPVLPAATLAESCYSNMFKSCSSLAATPELPATTLATSCYSSMFNGCTSLVSAAALPVTTLTTSCYESMFSGCTSLKNPPTMPTGTVALSSHCYKGMFEGCTSLVTLSGLPSTVTCTGTDPEPYTEMFKNCSGLFVSGSETGLVNPQSFSVAYPTGVTTGICTNMFSGCSCPEGETLPETPAAGTTYYVGSETPGTIPTWIFGTFYAPHNMIMVGGRGYEYAYKLTNDGSLAGDFFSFSRGGWTSDFNESCSVEIRPGAMQIAFTVRGSEEYVFSFQYGSEENPVVTGVSANVAGIDFTRRTDLVEPGSCEIVNKVATITRIQDANYMWVAINSNTGNIIQFSMYSSPVDLSYYYTQGADTFMYSCLNQSSGEWQIARGKTISSGGSTKPYITFESDNAFSLNISSLSGAGPGVWDGTMLYSNGAEPSASTTWSVWNRTGGEGGIAETISAAQVEGAGKYYLYLKGGYGTEECPANIRISATVDEQGQPLTTGIFNITGELEGDVKVKGDIRCLFNSANLEAAAPAAGALYYMFAGISPRLGDVSELDISVASSQYCCANMFFYSVITTAPILSATDLGVGCYMNMFQNCTALTTATALPATTLAAGCYYQMFNGCTGLTTAPVLSATTLAEGCCQEMFRECTGLTTAPTNMLPATTLAPYCYKGMFYECSSLTTAPAIPATTVAEWCCAQMFYGCSSLATAPTLPATILADDCYNQMFQACASLTTVPTISAETLAAGCCYGMFQDCTSLTTPPALPATTLVGLDEEKHGCYEAMFAGCTALTTLPKLKAIALTDGCYRCMFMSCAGVSLNTTQTVEYVNEYRIPWSETGTEGTQSLYSMFTDTGSVSDPSINTTYYTKATVLE